MPHSFTSLHYHIVFGTRDHLPVLADYFAERLYGYIIGIIRTRGGVVVSIGGVADHLHILARLDQNSALADVMRELKSVSSRWARETFVDQSAFAWQEGYGAFTVSTAGVPRVKAYIDRQVEHHRQVTFREELVEFLQCHGIEYDDRYV